jgi:hypothetical protein
MHAVQLLVQRLLQLTPQHILDLVGIVGVHSDHAQVVADDRAGEPIGEYLGEFLESSTLLRFLDVRLERHVALGGGKPGQKIQQAQQVDVVALLESGTRENLLEAAQRVLEFVHGVGHGERGNSGPPMVHSSNGSASISTSMLPPETR